MFLIVKNSHLISKIICIFIVFYISIDLPKLYFLTFILFIIFLIYEKIKFKIQYIFNTNISNFILFRVNLIQSNLNNLSSYYNIIWGITALLISLIIYSCLEKNN